MAGKEQRYISYMLRLWRIRSQGKRIWRASLESPLTGERWGFADLAALFAFLEKEIGDSAQAEVRSVEADDRGHEDIQQSHSNQ
jgi:hypothetical protein